MITHPQQFLIDGIDRLGKSTLAKSIIKRLGYHLVVHSGKPQPLSCYPGTDNEKLKQYQQDCTEIMFQIMNSGVRIIFDRTHLGEMVYAPLYRDYDGSYVYDSEVTLDQSETKIRLILLTTSNFDMLQDDGKSINWSNKKKEQELFLRAFLKSHIFDKVLIDVHDGCGSYKPPQMILDEVLKIL